MNIGKENNDKNKYVSEAEKRTLEIPLVIGLSLIFAPIIVEIISASFNTLASSNLTFVVTGILILLYAGAKRVFSGQKWFVNCITMKV